MFGSAPWIPAALALVLAVVAAVCFAGVAFLQLLAARATSIRPVAGVIYGDALCVAGTGAFVLLGALPLGAWAVQQAYATGAAAVVLSTLTVGDPVVAILLSAGLLGEPLYPGPAAAAIMVGCAVVAAAGVWLLAEHHPAVPSPVPASPAEPVRDLVAVD